MLFKAFKGNQVACHLASNQQLMVTTKCFLAKRCFFSQFAHHAKKNPEGWLDMEKCSADMMNADCLAKGPAKIKFNANQLWIKGWQHTPATNPNHTLRVTRQRAKHCQMSNSGEEGFNKRV